MNRPRPTRRAAVAAVIAAVALAGCGAPGVPGSGTGYGDPGSTVTDQQAGRILQRVMDADTAVRSGKPEATAQIPVTYAAEGARAADALTKLIGAGAQGKIAQGPSDLKVLANSRGAQYPRYILGASTPAGAQLPHVHLLVATNARTPYRLAMSAQMLPGATINAFPTRDEGTQIVTTGEDMDVKPVDVLKSYADGLSGKKENALYQNDTFLEQIVNKMEEQKKASSNQADLVQTNQLMPDPVAAFRELNGDTLVLGAIERTSEYTIKSGQQLKAPPMFKAFVPGRTVLVQQARIQVVQFLVFTVPKSGKARLVAATEQVAGASGL
ncbi:hypothetical protein [Austwickia chelonae]|uniref:hypothetical protein n=1 Tax=Austwickia chelonae TaxID=100225 RepID=UPI000E22D52B|nr:hypothetical protein [Austwickia chelonae]